LLLALFLELALVEFFTKCHDVGSCTQSIVSMTAR